MAGSDISLLGDPFFNGNDQDSVLVLYLYGLRTPSPSNGNNDSLLRALHIEFLLF
jgi:hypothetical protein